MWVGLSSIRVRTPLWFTCSRKKTTSLVKSRIRLKWHVCLWSHRSYSDVPSVHWQFIWISCSRMKFIPNSFGNSRTRFPEQSVHGVCVRVSHCWHLLRLRWTYTENLSYRIHLLPMKPVSVAFREIKSKVPNHSAVGDSRLCHVCLPAMVVTDPLVSNTESNSLLRPHGHIHCEICWWGQLTLTFQTQTVNDEQ